MPHVFTLKSILFGQEFYGHHGDGESCKPGSSEGKIKLENQLVHSGETLEEDVGSRNDSLRDVRAIGG